MIPAHRMASVGKIGFIGCVYSLSQTAVISLPLKMIILIETLLIFHHKAQGIEIKA